MPDVLEGLSQSARNYLDDLGNRPAARQPATIGEAWNSEWQRGGLDTITGIGKPLNDARTELSSAIEAAAGKPIGQYAAEQRIPLGAGVTVDQNIKALNDLADTLPEEAKKTVDPLRDVRRRSMQKAQQIEHDAADVSSATYGLGGIATAWAAGVARQTADPVNLALMAATAPLGGPIATAPGKFIAGSALGGMIAQAGVEPYIEPARAELGLEAGAGRAAANILQAGVGGAALGAAGVGLHHLFGAAAESFRGARPIDVRESPTPNISGEDFAAAALHAERDAVTPPSPGVDPIAHTEAVNQAAQAMEDGAPLAAPPPAPAIAPQPVSEFPSTASEVAKGLTYERARELAQQAKARDETEVLGVFQGDQAKAAEYNKQLGRAMSENDAASIDARQKLEAITKDLTPEQLATLEREPPQEQTESWWLNVANTIREHTSTDASMLAGNLAHALENTPMHSDWATMTPREKLAVVAANKVVSDAATLGVSMEDVLKKVPAKMRERFGADAEFMLQIARASLEAQKTQGVPVGAPQIAPPAPPAIGPVEPELPLPKPIEPKGPPTELKEPAEVVGDPVLAKDLDARLTNLPEADQQIFHVEQPDKTIKSGTAKSFLQEIADNAKAVSELIDCVGKEPP